jgi:hypothetical protein
MSDDDEGARYTLIRALKYRQIVLDRQILSLDTHMKRAAAPLVVLSY